MTGAFHKIQERRTKEKPGHWPGEGFCAVKQRTQLPSQPTTV